MNERDFSFEKRKYSKKRSNGKHKNAAPAPRDYGFDDFLGDIGNRDLPLFFGNNLVQTKLFVSNPSDPYEREADRIANEVVSGGTSNVEGHVKTTPVQKKGGGTGLYVDASTEGTIKSLAGKGSPLGKGLKEYFEPRFGVDLGNVRIHTDGEANRLSQAIHARAFTHGNDIAFAQGQYQPETTEGKRLIAHELAHTMQQGGESIEGIVHRDYLNDKGNGTYDYIITDMNDHSLYFDRNIGLRNDNKVIQEYVKGSKIDSLTYFLGFDSYASTVSFLSSQGIKVENQRDFKSIQEKQNRIDELERNIQNCEKNGDESSKKHNIPAWRTRILELKNEILFSGFKNEILKSNGRTIDAANPFTLKNIPLGKDVAARLNLKKMRPEIISWRKIDELIENQHFFEGELRKDVFDELGYYIDYSLLDYSTDTQKIITANTGDMSYIEGIEKDSPYAGGGMWGNLYGILMYAISNSYSDAGIESGNSDQIIGNLTESNEESSFNKSRSAHNRINRNAFMSRSSKVIDRVNLGMAIVGVGSDIYEGVVANFEDQIQIIRISFNGTRYFTVLSPVKGLYGKITGMETVSANIHTQTNSLLRYKSQIIRCLEGLKSAEVKAEMDALKRKCLESG